MQTIPRRTFYTLSIVSCHTIPYHNIPYHTLPYLTIPYHTIPYLTITYLIILYHRIPYHTYHTITYHTIPCHTLPYLSIITYLTIPSHAIPYHNIPYTIPSHTIPYLIIPYLTIYHTHHITLTIPHTIAYPCCTTPHPPSPYYKPPHQTIPYHKQIIPYRSAYSAIAMIFMHNQPSPGASVAKWLAHLHSTSEAAGSSLSETFSMPLKPHVKRVKVNALPKVVGFPRVLRFPPTGKVDRVG
jgi:hypothetical protein